MDYGDNGDPIARGRFNSPFPTERHQPWDQTHALKTQPMDTTTIAPYAVATKITMGLTGQGATFELASPIGENWHEHLTADTYPAVVVR